MQISLTFDLINICNLTQLLIYLSTYYVLDIICQYVIDQQH